jgi:hypothetical protein
MTPSRVADSRLALSRLYLDSVPQAPRLHSTKKIVGAAFSPGAIGCDAPLFLAERQMNTSVLLRLVSDALWLHSRMNTPGRSHSLHERGYRSGVDRGAAPHGARAAR